MMGNTHKEENKQKSSKSRIKCWYTVLICGLMGCTMAGYFTQFSMTVTELSKVLNLTVEQLLFSDTIKAFAIVVAMMISGSVYNKFGLRKTFVIAMFLLVCPQLFILKASNVYILAVLKTMQGLSAVIFPVFLITILKITNENEQGLATAVFNGIFYGGSGLGALVSGYAITKYGWESSYYVLAAISVVFGSIWLLTIKETNDEAIVNKVEDKEQNENIKENKQEKNAYKEIIKLPEVWLLICIFIAYTWVLQVVAIDIPIFAEHLKYNFDEIGKLMTSSTIGIIASTFAAGSLSDFLALKSSSRVVGRTITILIGAIIIIISSFMMVTMDLTNFTLFYFVVFLLSFGGAWGIGSFWSIVSELFTGDDLTLATGFAGGIGDLSMPIAPFVVGVVFGAKGLWSYGWITCLLIGIVSALASIMLIKRSTKKVDLQNKNNEIQNDRSKDLKRII